MKLLISTMLQLILWDGQPRTVLSGELSQGQAHYYGVTWDSNTLYVAGCQDFRYGVYCLDPKTFAVRDILFGDLHEIHQILWHSGLLYVTNTGKNRVETWDGTRWAYKTFNPHPCDVDHLNGISCNGEQLFLSEHRHKDEAPSVVRVCDRNLNLIQTLEVGPPIHNVCPVDHSLYSIVSRMPCELVEVSLTGEPLRHIPLPKLDGLYLRGLAYSQSYWFVGASRWEKDRGQRHVGHALVVVLNNRFREVDRIEIPDAGPVCDVQVIDGSATHNGLEYPG